MNWLPSIWKRKNEVEVQARSLEVQAEQTKAIQSVGQALQTIASFVAQGGLATLLGEYSRSQIAKDILGGLAAHSGRNALDARFIEQNAIEVNKAIEAIFDKAEEKAKARAAGEIRDSEIKDSEKEYREWKEKHGQGSADNH